MTYFTEEFNGFFKGLAKNNHKEWFHENKKTYDRAVKKAFAKFLTDLIEQIRERFDPELYLEVKNAVFRINRDIRFSKDKSPYKLQLGAVISRGGRKNMQIAGLYLQFGVGDIWIGCGFYAPNKENLRAIRKKIASNPSAFRQLISDNKFKNIYGEIQGEKNKRIPKEFREAFESEALIANKQFYFMATYDDENILKREDLLEWVLKHYEAGIALNKYLNEAINEERE